MKERWEMTSGDVVEITIDTAAIMRRAANRAINNKTGRGGVANGMCKAKVVKRVTEPRRR